MTKPDSSHDIVEIEGAQPLSPHNRAVYEAGKQLLVESLSTGREFCKFMVGVATGAVPIYLSLLALALPDGYRLSFRGSAIARVPALGFLVAAIVFAVGFFPKTETFSLDIVDAIEGARTKAIQRRQRLATIGFAASPLRC